MSAPIDNMLKTINLIQKTSHTIEKDLDNMVGPEALQIFADEMFNIIMDEVEDINIVNRIALKLGRALNKTMNGDPEEDTQL